MLSPPVDDAKLYAYFQQLPVAAAVFLGPEQIFDFVNEAYAELTGKSPRDLLGQSLLAVYPELKGTPIEAIHRAVYQTGRPQEVQEHAVEFQRGGQLYHGFFNTKFQPLKNAHGTTEGVIAVGYEVTELVKAKNQLATSHQQINQLADAMPQVVWMAEPDGSVTYYNRRVAEFNGATQTADGKWQWEGVVHPNDLRATAEAWQRAVATGNVYQHEHQIHMRDGSYQWHLSRGVPQYDATGVITGWVGTATNVDEQKQASQKLKESEERFRNMADNAPVMIWVTNPEGYCQYLNHQWLAYTGQTLEEGQGMGWVNAVHPADRQAAADDFVRASANGANFSHEYRLRKYDGTYQWMIDAGVPRHDEQGRFLGYIGSVVNIDARRKAEEVLQENENRFRTLAEALPQLVWMTDEQGAYEYASRQWEAYSGLDPTHPDTWEKMVHPEEWASLTQVWQHSLATGQAYKTEVRLRHRDGTYRWHFVHGEPIRNESGQIIRWIGAFTDVHDQKAFAEQLEKLVAQRTRALYESNQFLEDRNAQLRLANKELESFNYVASHDLQEPLRKIQSFISFLDRKNLDEQKRAEFLGRIDASARRMSDLLQGILNYSRLSNTEVQFVQTDLNGILDQVKSDFELVLEEKRGELRSDDLPVIEAVPLQMSQLFANLIGNALKFSGEKPLVTITSTHLTGEQLPADLNASAEQRFVVLAFRDNGIGFEARYAQRIFSLFQRLHTRQAYGGTGIGLTICKKIVDNHHGYITAEGQPGEGAIFTVYLPASQAVSEVETKS